MYAHFAFRKNIHDDDFHISCRVDQLEPKHQEIVFYMYFEVGMTSDGIPARAPSITNVLKMILFNFPNGAKLPSKQLPL